ncbi:arginine deiminase [Thiospirochaeta perfilievii]|uniref:Arginine deiminase n=1 Tax=Thiospirochaeta perfilievii TaxID=252967 RepID=A0A5C1Q7R5_9SPIO|nr:arginine deiminase [Thiospirochaeta perfilievii]QEN03427.1 arginine deiminase [Thiospirochaeta perfilievii]
MSFYNVKSEVGKLEAVLLHRPGKELEKLTPQYLEELLFDDIPWLGKMQEEHDSFADALRNRGCKVYYYDQMLEEILNENHVKNEIISEIIGFSGISKLKEKDVITEYLKSRDSKELTEILISGLHKNVINYQKSNRSLSYYIKDDYPYYINPIPNLYFTRDPGTVIGNGVSINSMKTHARNRETMTLSYINKYHRDIKASTPPLWYNYHNTDSIEGGDILVLSEKAIAVGCSARTSPEAIEVLAENLFKVESGIREVLVIEIPVKRAYMHLDTVFTMLDINKFTIFPEIKDELKIFKITPALKGIGLLKITPKDSLRTALNEALDRDDVQILHSGGHDKITAAREQWNDSTNTLAVAPGTVVTYRRNKASNETLRNNGIEVIEIEGSELVRGRGGPRCMSMPLRRASII